jgi:copper(I)-binding protein
MNTVHRRRICLQAALAGGLAWAGMPARACEFFSSNLRVTHPWTRASGDHDNSAIVAMRFDQVEKDDRLIGVETMVASGVEMVRAGVDGAQKGVDFFIPKGQESELSETGTFLRLTGLRMPLDFGRVYPMRLHFETGGILNTDLSVEFARFR